MGKSYENLFVTKNKCSSEAVHQNAQVNTSSVISFLNKVVG